jgi:adenylate cyclase
MTTMPAPPADPADLSAWIARAATEEPDGHALLEALGLTLNRMGVPVSRMSIGAPSISPAHRGITLVWRRGLGVAFTPTVHGPEGEAEFDRSPIAALRADGQRRGRWNLEAGEGCNRFRLMAEVKAEGGTDYLMHIVRFPPGLAIMGASLSYVTDRAGGFTDADLALIDGHLPAFGLAVLRLCLSKTLSGLLGAYLGPRTAARVMAGQARRGQGELMPAAILLADLKGFTAAADREDPRRLVGWLDEHLDALGLGVEPNGGEILKFTGDGFIAVFPVQDRDAAPCGVCGQALAAARAGLAHNRLLEERRRASGEPALEADLALHYGDVVYGNVGTASRLDFTAIGRAVNEASRIETLCDRTGRHILMSDSFARRCEADMIDLGLFPLRGVAAEQRLWTVAEA